MPHPRKKPRVAKNQPEPVVVKTLEECIEEERRRVVGNSNVIELKQELHILQQSLDSLGDGRHHIRRKKDLQIQIDELQQKIEYKESGQELRDFESKVEPYARMHRQLSEKTGAVSRGRKRTVAGGKLLPTKQAKAGEGAAYDLDAIRDEFRQNVQGISPPLRMRADDKCETCGLDLIMMSQESRLGCPNCAQTKLYMQATSTRIAFGEEVEFSSFSYDRGNHLADSLARFQAKETTVVDFEVIRKVMVQLYRKGFRDPEKVTQTHVCKALEELKLKRDHLAQITARITGRLPPRLTPYQENHIVLMFQSIQMPFYKHCPPTRSNFLSYPYCLYKFFELMGWDEFLSQQKLLKGDDKLQKQDEIWKNICMELDWSYIPTRR